MDLSRRRLTVLAVTLLVLAASLVGLATRVRADLDRGWAGFMFQTATPEELEQSLSAMVLGGGSRMVAGVASGSPAQRAGITVGDRVVSIDGIPIENGRALLEHGRTKRPGDTVTYRIERDDELVEIELELGTAFRSPQIVAGVASSLLVGLAFLAISALVAWAQPRSRSALVFFLMAVVGAVVFLGWAMVEPVMPDLSGLVPLGLDPGLSLIFVLFLLLSLALANLLLHLVLVFPDERPVLRQWPEALHWVHTVPFLPVAAVAAVMLGGIMAKHLSPLVPYGAALLGAAVGAGVVARRTARSGPWIGLRTSPWAVQGGALAAVLALGPAMRRLEDETALVFGIVTGVAVMFVTLALLLAWSILTCVVLARGWRDAGVEARHQLRWPVWGTLVAIGGSTAAIVAMLAVAPMVDVANPLYATTSIVVSMVAKLIYILIPISFAFGILKYRLMAIDVIVRKTLVYAALTGFVVAGYLVIVGLFGLVLVAVAGVRSQAVAVVATVVVAALLIPVRSRIQAFVDRRFFRRERRHDAARERIAAAARSAVGLASLVPAIAEEVQRGLACSSVALLVRDPASGRLRSVATVGVPDAVRERIAVAPGEAPSEPVVPLDRVALGDRIRAALSRSGAGLAAPARHRDDLLGLLLVGSPLAREPYDEDDRRFVVDAADQLAVAVATLQPRRAELEFDEAREIQRSLLPADLPTISGVEVAARWEPAREVSGDAYDVLRLDDRRIALTVGDVAGKGMPAALLMSSLQAAVKAVAEPGRGPSEVCARVRQVVRQNLSGGRFVTFVYAVLDREAGELAWCNAGHVPPLLLRSGGRCEWLAEGGPAVARVLSQGGYAEGRTRVAPGDLVVLFTDGVTEAASPTGEMFGEDRVVATVRTAADAPAVELARALATAARAFAAGDAQDDVTVVVARVAEI